MLVDSISKSIHFLRFMKPEVSFPHTKQPSSCSCRKSDKSNIRLSNRFILTPISILLSHLILSLHITLFPSDFPTIILYASIVFPIPATCSIHIIILFQITKLMHNSFILQQYVCYITIPNMFRAAPCSSSGGQIVLLQPLVSSLSVNSCTVCWLTVD